MIAISLSPWGRGWGEGVRKLQNQAPSSEPPQPVLLPSGEKGRSAPAVPYSSSSPLASKIRFADGAASAWIKTRAASGCLALVVTPAE